MSMRGRDSGADQSPDHSEPANHILTHDLKNQLNIIEGTPISSWPMQTTPRSSTGSRP